MLGQSSQVPIGFRPIFYKGVGSSGILYGFKADTIKLIQKGEVITTQGYIAIGTSEITCDGCSAIFGGKMVTAVEMTQTH